MALTVNLKKIEYLEGKIDRVVRITFREKTMQSNIVRSAKGMAYFGQAFEWPVARPIEQSDFLDIQVLNYSKYLTDRLLGTYRIGLQTLIRDGEMSISESLTDKNNRVISATISFEMLYSSPGGQVSTWSNRFDYSIPVDVDDVTGEDLTLAEERQKMLVLPNMPHRDDDNDEKDDDYVSETASLNFIMDNERFEKKTPINYVDLQPHRPRDFEITVTIIEGQQLAGLDIDPVVQVEVGEQMKYTNIRRSTNTPFYNEYFVFTFNETPAILFDKIINISAYHSYPIPGRDLFKAGNVIGAKKLIGAFRCDVGMVYSAPDHQYYHKWAVLLDPRDLEAGAKGYIKCDIAVLTRGQIMKPPKDVKAGDSDNIEGNLLLPAGVSKTRHRAVYQINIYRAEDIPQMEMGVLASVQKVLTRKDIAFVDAIVQVSFVGQIGRTSVVKSYNPEWNETLKFVDMFPPLCNRIKVQLCDDETLSVEPVATHFIELSQIMDAGSGAEGILPTFGPSWVNLYGAPRGFKILGSGIDELNEGVGEGTAFRGRVLMSLKTTVDPNEMASISSKVIKEKLKGGLADKPERKPFLLFVAFFEATMIDAKLKDKQIFFEVSMGKFGNMLDAKSTTVMFEEPESSDEEDAFSIKQPLLQKQHDEDARQPCHSTTHPRLMKMMNRVAYGYVPFEEEKQCCYIVSLFEDQRKRLLNSNVLSYIANNLENGLTNVRQRLAEKNEDAYRRMKGVMEQLKTDCDMYLRLSLGVGAGSGKTKLDQFRIKACTTHITNIRKKAIAIRRTTTAETLEKHLVDIKDVTAKLKRLSKEPQHSLPDVIIWMIANNERVAYHRIPARHILYAVEEPLLGKYCGKMQTMFLKKPGKRGLGQKGWGMQAMVNANIWLGDYDATNANKNYMSNLPAGFEPITENDSLILPPIALVYNESSFFQFRAYLFQARALIPSDDTGLSDPFARVIILNQCVVSQVVFESLSPTWDEVLIVNDILLYGSKDNYIAHPPVIVIEIFDYDTVGAPEFLGRVTASPSFKFVSDNHEPAKLHWWDVYRGPHKSGQLLAAFELLEGEEKDLPPLPPYKMKGEKILESREKIRLFTIPKEIKPVMIKYRIEVFFRGVHCLRRVQMIAVEHPHIVVECGGVSIASKSILNMSKNCNFEDPLNYIDVDLPEDKMYWPPLTIRCLDTRPFGRTVLAGIHTISKIEDFMFNENANKDILDLVSLFGENEPLEDEAPTDEPGNVTPSLSVKSGKSGKIKTLAEDATSGGKGKVKTPITAGDGDGGQDKDNYQLIDDDAMEQSNGVAKPRTPADALSESKTQDGAKGREDGARSGAKSKLSEAGGDEKKSLNTTDAQLLDKLNKKGDKQVTFSEAKKPKKDVMLSPAEEAKKRAAYKEMIAELDWWSKYYLSKEEAMKTYLKFLAEARKKDARENDDDDDLGLEVVDYTSLDMDALSGKVAEAKAKALAAEMADKGKKKKKKKKEKSTDCDSALIPLLCVHG